MPAEYGRRVSDPRDTQMMHVTSLGTSRCTHFRPDPTQVHSTVNGPGWANQGDDDPLRAANAPACRHQKHDFLALRGSWLVRFAKLPPMEHAIFRADEVLLWENTAVAETPHPLK